MKKNQKIEPTEFEKVTKRYGVKRPDAIKLKIIWLHMQALVAQVYEVDKPDSPGKKLLGQYQRDWKLCEQQESIFIA